MLGSVRVELFAVDSYATATAQFFDGPTAPGTGPVEVKQEQGGCKLLVPVTCPTDCATGSYCAGNKQCVQKPQPVNVGVIKVDGLSFKVDGAPQTSLALDPVAPMFAYSGVTLQPYPPCEEGGDVKAKADKFSFTGKCITALKVTSPLPIPVKSGEPVHLTWTAPGKTGISRLQISLEISHHGGYKGQIDCDVADTGSFDIPAPLVTALVARGLAGYPTIELARVSTATDSTQPGASLQVVSSAGQLAVDTGVISCGAGDSPPCASPTMCDDASKICK